MNSLDISTPLIFKLNSSPRLWNLFNVKCPCFHRHKYKYKLSVCLPNAISARAASVSSSSTTSIAATTQLRQRREKVNIELDSITILNERIRRDYSKRETSSPAMDSKEADKYIQMVKEQQQRGLQKLKGEREAKEGGFFSYKADPYTLCSGDYVVHKKVGIGRFVGIKFDVSKKGSTEPIEYVFIEYADGMAKLPVKQASRMLYRYNL